MDDFRKYFSKAIQVKYPETFPEIMSRIDSNYNAISKDTQFALTSPNPLDKRLDFCSYFLALIIALDHAGEPYDRIRVISLEIATEYVRPKTRLHHFLNQLLPRLIDTWPGQILIRSLHKKISVNNNPDGFVANILTDKQETFGLGYGVDIIECGICKLFKKHKFERYAAILCEVDEITSELAGLKLVRTGTIANGAKKCDFRFQRLSAKT